MPFMQHITWSGIAMHAGPRPGYPASHGCIRLPENFAVWLFHATRVGARVIVTREAAPPVDIASPKLFVPPKLAGDTTKVAMSAAATPSGAAQPGAAVVIADAADKKRAAGRAEAERPAAADLGVREPQAEQGLRAPGLR
jgi:hypothetical protein